MCNIRTAITKGCLTACMAGTQEEQRQLQEEQRLLQAQLRRASGGGASRNVEGQLPPPRDMGTQTATAPRQALPAEPPLGAASSAYDGVHAELAERPLQPEVRQYC